MDFADSPEHAAFRAEFRHWLEANLPPKYVPTMPPTSAQRRIARH